MASLKEVKDRITSVKSTRKITSAMKMIASAKLHKAQAAITNFLPYSEKLNSILSNLLSSDIGFDSPFSQQREVKKVAVVVFSSNTSLCGAFNSNVFKEFRSVYSGLRKETDADNILIYPVGKKIEELLKKQKIKSEGSYQEMLEKPIYEPVAELAQGLIDKFLRKDLDKIVLVYHHFKSTASQIIVQKTYLPFDVSEVQPEGNDSAYQSDYILEPSRDEILSELIPKVLVSRLYAALLDTVASEHAARTMAMQVATTNADDLIQDLTVQYNKTRQQSITNELLDIIGGAAALE
ncbi:MAG: F0F1 ATP synthase subunit gamma [Dysgonomonas sp.]